SVAIHERPHRRPVDNSIETGTRSHSIACGRDGAHRRQFRDPRIFVERPPRRRVLPFQGFRSPVRRIAEGAPCRHDRTTLDAHGHRTASCRVFPAGPSRTQETDPARHRRRTFRHRRARCSVPGVRCKKSRGGEQPPRHLYLLHEPRSQGRPLRLAHLRHAQLYGPRPYPAPAGEASPAVYAGHELTPIPLSPPSDRVLRASPGYPARGEGALRLRNEKRPISVALFFLLTLFPLPSWERARER